MDRLGLRPVLAAILLIAAVLVGVMADPGVAGPPTTCPQGGIQVSASANLHTVIENSSAETYCLSAATYTLTSALLPDDGDVIQGKPTSLVNGHVIAQTFIKCVLADQLCPEGVIKSSHTNMTLTLISLDISGACCSNQEGADGINGNFGQMRNLTVSWSRIHDNDNGAIEGVNYGLKVDHTEIDHNGNIDDPNGNSNNYDAGIKTVHYAIVTDSYFYSNDPNGMWWDCDAPGGVFTDNVVSDNQRNGLFIEISSGSVDSTETIPTGEAFGWLDGKIADNTITGNNIDDAFDYGGVAIVDSQNVDLYHNEIFGNTNYEVHIFEDTRIGGEHNTCSDGFELAGVTIHGNHYGPQPIVECNQTGVTCSGNTYYP